MPRNILITGGTDGLGLATATQLAAAGNRVIVHGRRADRLQQVADEIEAKTGNRPETVIADLSSLEQVGSLPSQVGELTDSLQVLINNAGIGTGEPDGRHRSTSAEGYELRLSVNYLAPFDLTLRLLPLLQAGRPSRIVHVASDGQEPVRFNDLMLTEDYSGYQAYCQSKLALVAFRLLPRRDPRRHYREQPAPRQFHGHQDRRGRRRRRRPGPSGWRRRGV
jgi:NAD(P)-dependent dehydrogenase (short-subunit alcohol dehydrogenase family)